MHVIKTMKEIAVPIITALIPVIEDRRPSPACGQCNLDWAAVYSMCPRWQAWQSPRLPIVFRPSIIYYLRQRWSHFRRCFVFDWWKEIQERCFQLHDTFVLLVQQQLTELYLRFMLFLWEEDFRFPGVLKLVPSTINAIANAEVQLATQSM